MQKTTLQDFPGKVSAVVFAQGCNFYCPYCHNPDLVAGRLRTRAMSEIFAFLKGRRNVLAGVVVSGGEPTLHDDLPDFCARLKRLGYAVKLDTNGSRPDMLRELLRAELLDYVAMDVKADPENYPAALCAQDEGKDVPCSMELLAASGTRHEFRVPCVEPYVTAESFAAIFRRVGQAPLFLHAVRLGRVLRPDCFPGQAQPLSREAMAVLHAEALRQGLDCRIR